MHLKGLLYAGFICYLCMFAGAAGSIRRRPRARFAVFFFQEPLEEDLVNIMNTELLQAPLQMRTMDYPWDVLSFSWLEWDTFHIISPYAEFSLTALA